MATIKVRNELERGNVQTITSSIRMGYQIGDVVRVHGLLAGPGNAGKDVDVRVYWVDDARWWQNAWGWLRWIAWPKIKAALAKEPGK